MSCGQTPRPRHDGPLRTGGGLAQTKRRGGCRVDSCDHAATGEPPGVHEVSEPWRVALQAGPEALTPSGRADKAQRWQSRRAETVLAATVGQPARRSRRLGRQRKASQGTLAALLRLRPSRVARQRIAHQHLAPPRPPRGRVMRTPGRGRSCFAPARRVSMPCRFGSVPTPTAPVPAKADATNRAAGHGCDPPRPDTLTAPVPAPTARTRWRRNLSGDVLGPIVHVNPPTNPIVQTRRRSRSITVFIRSREPASPPSNTARIAANRSWRCAIRRGGGITFRCG